MKPRGIRTDVAVGFSGGFRTVIWYHGRLQVDAKARQACSFASHGQPPSSKKSPSLRWQGTGATMVCLNGFAKNSTFPLMLQSS